MPIFPPTFMPIDLLIICETASWAAPAAAPSSAWVSPITPSRFEATTGLLEKLIDEETQIITLFYGNDVSIDEVEQVSAFINQLRSDIEIETVEGKQDIYSYIIAVE